MFKQLKTLTLIVVGIFVMVGCDGLLDTENSTAVDPDTAQENIEGIEAILTSVYNRLQSEFRYGREITLAPDVLADNTEQHPITSGRYDGQAVNSQGSHITFWNTAYLTINEANYVIEGAENIEGVAQEVRDQLMGEALFQRGFAYFDLARTYGYEPGREVGGWTQSAIIRTNPTRDLGDADLRARSTNVEVYGQAQQDLEDALELLQGNDRGVYFANYAAANALLARLHLYLENWEEAVDYADEAIVATDVNLVDSESDFESNTFSQVPNPESIMELSINPIEESLGSNVGLCPYTNPTHWFDVIPSENLLDTYTLNDYRNNWFAEADDGFPYTLKWNCSTGPFDDNIPLIRLPELYLIKAEAHAELDQLDLALDALESIQTTRGLTPFVSDNKVEIIDEVMVERRRELNFEGHRWYDLKRRAMDIPKQEGATTVPYDDFRILSVLPQGEVDNNPNLDQNPGY
ncbi:RagB/SusD family nutrient uptake outer membrane protein [soil metagenome]